MAETIHVALQSAMVVMTSLLGLMMFVRAKDVRRGSIQLPSRTILIGLGVFLLAHATRQAWWHALWTLRILDLDVAASGMVNSVIVPATANAIAILAGTIVFTAAARPYVGRHAATIAIACVASSVSLGALMVSGWIR